SQNIEYLVYKFNNGTITSEELTILIAWYNSHDDENVTIPTRTIETKEDLKARMLLELMSKFKESQPIAKKQYSLYRWISAAAAILFIAFGTWIIITNKNTVDGRHYVENSIEPGGNKATLTLANGKTIILNSSQSGIATGEKITYLNGQPVEDAELPQSNQSQNLLALHTPRGGTYEIKLPDGTEVWLNAGTTIKYPSSFSQDARIVYLEGEAYFHVKSTYKANGNKIPFKVIANQQEVEVLGTQFNMNAYPEQKSVKTTLVEGKVLVSNKSEHLMLLPNQQAITSSEKTYIKAVNVNNYTAWREGKFSFDGKTFEETMSEIARWYDLTVVYKNSIPNEELVGDAFRNQNIHLVLRLLDVAEIDYNLNVSLRQLTIIGKKNRM
ncbi:MAG: FecR family protein, partial [Pedobacter sp.]